MSEINVQGKNLHSEITDIRNITCNVKIQLKEYLNG